MKTDYRISKLETALIVGIIGCLLLATWELMKMMSMDWLGDWVKKDDFTNRRIILYGIAFTFSITALLVAIKTINKESRFIFSINRALLWYGALLLISTIAVFVFDCLPEIAAGIIGAGVFAYAIYLLQKKYFSEERVIASRIEKSQCVQCGTNITHATNFCPSCGNDLKKECINCNAMISNTSKFCTECGESR